MLKYNFYDASNFPLKKFNYRTIPRSVIMTIDLLNNKFELIIRGGLAYIILSKNYNYILKDIDLIMDIKEKEAIFTELKKVSKHVFYNKNSLGDDVLTIFFESPNINKYKIDILLKENLIKCPRIKTNIIKNKVYVMNILDLWYDRLRKISEKNRRNHSDFKTLNHYNVIIHLCNILMYNDIDIFNREDHNIEVVIDKANNAQMVLSKLISKKQLVIFENNISKVIKEYWSE